MSKIDDLITAVADGYQNPEWRSGTAMIPDEQIEQLGVRRKKAGEAQHKLWYFSVGETGQQLATFWGHRFSDALKKCMTWRGLATKTKRGPKAAATTNA